MTTLTNTSEFIIEMDAPAHNQNEAASTAKPRDISALLRTFGAIAVIASLSLFLIEGWTDGNDLNRYFKLLAQTGLIAGAGIFLSTVVKEAKGARVFFGLGLIAAVANFTILGALVYSVLPLDSAQGDYGSMLKWQAVSWTKLIPLAVGTFAIMGLLAKFSYAIFARNASNQLTVIFTLLCAALLVPVREPMLIAPLAAISLFIAIQTAVRQLKSEQFAKTAEAKFALATLFLPGGIMVCRSLGLYAVDELVILTFCAAVYHALRSTYSLISNQTGKQLSMVVQAFAGAGIALTLGCLVEPVSEAVMVLVWSLVVVVVNFDLAQHRSNKSEALTLSIFLLLSALAISAINVIAVLATATLSMQLVSLINLLALIALCGLLDGNEIKVAASRIVSTIALCICALNLTLDIVAWFNVGAWALVGVAGVSLILLGSLYDRYGAQWKLSLRRNAN